MTTSAEIPSCSCYFEAQHEQHTHPALRELEKCVLGCDFGGTSWTTKLQADKIPAALGLDLNTSLLEIGAGTGWPGIYMTIQSACEVTLLDIPLNALKHAAQRAVDEQVESRCRAVCGSGTALPFASGSFDAINHSDVLCCLPDKLEMLKECRRVVRKHARMLFYVIAPATGLSECDLATACEIGPPFVGVPDDYDELLKASAWQVLEITDLCEDYLHALLRLVNGLEAGAEELETVMGTTEFSEYVSHRRSQIDAVQRGLLVRELYLVEAV